MRSRALAFAAVCATGLVGVVPSPAAQGPAGACGKWEECRQLALDARAAGDFARFHDLAWRAVQAGPASDPSLLYLLARAQSLGGRPQDALVILGRLLERGGGFEARTEPDFERARRLPGWQDLELLMERAAESAPPAAPAPAVPTPASAAPVAEAPSAVPGRGINAGAIGTIKPSATALPPSPPAALRFDLRPSDEVSRFAAAPFAASGLAWDAASRRFLLSDAQGRQVLVVGEGRDRSDVLVRAATAQFHDVMALEIDARRGDLWVVSSDPDSGAGALHRHQLISGRALATFQAPDEAAPVRLIDAALTPGGTVVVLDGVSPRLFGLRTGGKSLDVLMTFDVGAPTSLAIAGDERTAFVAHQDGIVRLDLQQRTATAVTPPSGVRLGGFARIRWHQGGLLGIQTRADGTAQVVRIAFNRARAATEAVVVETLERGVHPASAAISGDDLYYLVTDELPSPATGAPEMIVVVRRIRLD